MVERTRRLELGVLRGQSSGRRATSGSGLATTAAETMSDVGCRMADVRAEEPIRSRSGIVEVAGVVLRSEPDCSAADGGAMVASAAPRLRVGVVLGRACDGSALVALTAAE